MTIVGLLEIMTASGSVMNSVFERRAHGPLGL